MNLYDFTQRINRTILDRGYDYFLEGRVQEAFELRENEYVFHIEGSDDYQVEIGLKDNGNIIYSVCDCPYDFGPVCKHEVAAYYQLLHMLNESAKNGEGNRKHFKAADLEGILAKLSKEELIQMVVDLADNDSALKRSLIVRYSNRDIQEELEECRKLIETIVRKYAGRGGFITYQKTSDFVFELEEVIEKSENAADLLQGLEIALLLLEEAVSAFQYADDSSGEIGSFVDRTMLTILEIVQQSQPGDEREEIFNRLLGFSDNDIFRGWENFQLELIYICFEFADEIIFRDRLRMKIESLLGKESSRFMKEDLLICLYQLIDSYGEGGEADRFIAEHLQYSYFRELLLGKCMKEKDYNRVINLAKEGERQDRDHPGLVFKWKKFRYQAYEYLSLKEEQQALAMDLFLNGKFDYYHDLKKLAADSDALYHNLKNELKSKSGWSYRELFQQLIETENDAEEMLEYIKRSPEDIEEYAEKLFEYRKDEVIEIYIEHIKSAASIAANRRAYQVVCDKNKNFKKLADKEVQEKLINELIVLYRKKPAFADELGKIKKVPSL